MPAFFERPHSPLLPPQPEQPHTLPEVCTPAWLTALRPEAGPGLRNRRSSAREERGRPLGLNYFSSLAARGNLRWAAALHRSGAGDHVAMSLGAAARGRKPSFSSWAGEGI